jgi:hypothetical protein
MAIIAVSDGVGTAVTNTGIGTAAPALTIGRAFLSACPLSVYRSALATAIGIVTITTTAFGGTDLSAGGAVAPPFFRWLAPTIIVRS